MTAKAKDHAEASEAATAESPEAETASFENGEVVDEPLVNAHVVGVVYTPPTEPDIPGGPVNPAPESAKG